VPVCFSDEMRNSRGALTPPIHPGDANPVRPDLALFLSHQPFSNGSGQPYIINILLEDRSMSNSWPTPATGWPPSLSLSMGRGGVANTLSGQRGAHNFLDMGSAVAILNCQRRRRTIACKSLVLPAQFGV